MWHQVSGKFRHTNQPWSSLVERDVGSYLPNCRSNFVIAIDALLQLFCIFKNTTDYHWADTSLHLLLAIALPRYIFLPQRFRVERNCQNFENEWANPGALLVYCPSLKSNFYRKIAPRLQRALNSDRRSRSWAAWPLYQHHCPTLLCCQNDKNIILIHENSTKMSWIGAKYV